MKPLLVSTLCTELFKYPVVLSRHNCLKYSHVSGTSLSNSCEIALKCFIKKKYWLYLIIIYTKYLLFLNYSVTKICKFECEYQESNFMILIEF